MSTTHANVRELQSISSTSAGVPAVPEVQAMSATGAVVSVLLIRSNVPELQARSMTHASRARASDNMIRRDPICQ